MMMGLVTSSVLMGRLASLENAAAWLQSLLIGGLATSVAVVAVAATGLMMLTGHVDWQRGARVVIGCFVLFGAPTIAAGLLGLAGLGSAEPAMPIEPPVVPAPIVATPAPPPPGYDPYAGASVPVR